VVGFTTGSRGEAPGKKENLCQEMMMIIIVLVVVVKVVVVVVVVVVGLTHSNLGCIT
jgi:hypothetical protein